MYEPTRVTQNTSTLIDPILVTNEVSVFDLVLWWWIKVFVYIHSYISIKTNVGYNKAYERKFWQYKKRRF